MTDPNAAQSAPRALVIIPKSVNYFYNQSGRRIAEALGSLGWAVDVRGLAEWDGEGGYDWCLLSNLTEILHGYGDEEGGLAKVRSLAGPCRSVMGLGIDSSGTHWFRHLNWLSGRAGVATTLDLGLRDQTPDVWPEYRPAYKFAFSGLTPSEVETTRAACGAGDADRPFPWAFVAHNTYQRVGLVDYLMQALDPRGFVYVPSLAPYTEKGSPHLNQQQYEAVLRKTRYQLWCSHHEHFYMEPERFRTSLLTGSVPVKVVDSAAAVPADAPFRYLMLERTQLAGRMTPEAFLSLRKQFCEDYLARPTLAAELARVLTEAGVWSGRVPAATAGPVAVARAA